MKESAVIEEKRRGSLMVEAGILLPICLFLLLAMAGAFRFLQLEESLLFSGFNQMQRCSAESAAAEPAELLLPWRIEQQAQAETRGWNQAGLRCYMNVLFDESYLKKIEAEEDRLVCLVECGWRSGAGKMAGVFSDRLRFCGRSFSGENQPCVWIFPKWGKRYHRQDCRVTGGPRRRTVARVAEEEGYTPCRVCMKGGGGF